MAGAARAVRIPRERVGPPVPAEEPGPESSPDLTPARSRRVANTAGSSRAYRTFLIFLVALVVIYAVFLGSAVSSSAAGTSSAIEGVLTASVIVALVVGWFVTLGQAPTMAWVDDGELVVRTRLGTARRYPAESVRIHVLRANAVGFLGPEPTEFVEVSAPGGVRRTYLVGTHFFDLAH